MLMPRFRLRATPGTRLDADWAKHIANVERTELPSLARRIGEDVGRADLATFYPRHMRHLERSVGQVPARREQKTQLAQLVGIYKRGIDVTTFYKLPLRPEHRDEAVKQALEAEHIGVGATLAQFNTTGPRAFAWPMERPEFLSPHRELAQDAHHMAVVITRNVDPTCGARQLQFELHTGHAASGGARDAAYRVVIDMSDRPWPDASEWAAILKCLTKEGMDFRQPHAFGKADFAAVMTKVAGVIRGARVAIGPVDIPGRQDLLGGTDTCLVHNSTAGLVYAAAKQDGVLAKLWDEAIRGRALRIVDQHVLFGPKPISRSDRPPLRAALKAGHARVEEIKVTQPADVRAVRRPGPLAVLPPHAIPPPPPADAARPVGLGPRVSVPPPAAAPVRHAAAGPAVDAAYMPAPRPSGAAPAPARSPVPGRVPAAP